MGVQQVEEGGPAGPPVRGHPVPIHTPESMSSSATIGFIAVCHTTAWESNSDMHQALSTTWWR